MDDDLEKLRIVLHRHFERRSQLQEAFREQLKRRVSHMSEAGLTATEAAMKALTQAPYDLIELALETGFRVGRPDADRGDFVFIAYASEDRDAAVALCDELGQANVRCFMDKRDIKPGADWDEAITGALAECAGLIVLISSATVDAARRGYIKAEIQAVFSQGKPVFPVLLDCTVAPERIENRLRTLQTVARDDAAALARLIDKLRSLL